MDVYAAAANEVMWLLAARRKVEAAQATGPEGGCDLGQWMAAAVKCHGVWGRTRVVIGHVLNMQRCNAGTMRE